MMHTLRTSALAAGFGGLLGLVAAGVWSLDTPDVPGERYYISDSEGDVPLPPAEPEYPFTGAGFWDFSPVPDGRLPVSLLLAMPLSTAVVGGIVGAAASAAGVRITRN